MFAAVFGFGGFLEGEDHGLDDFFELDTFFACDGLGDFEEFASMECGAHVVWLPIFGFTFGFGLWFLGDESDFADFVEVDFLYIWGVWIVWGGGGVGG